MDDHGPAGSSRKSKASEVDQFKTFIEDDQHTRIESIRQFYDKKKSEYQISEGDVLSGKSNNTWVKDDTKSTEDEKRKKLKSKDWASTPAVRKSIPEEKSIKSKGEVNSMGSRKSKALKVDPEHSNQIEDGTLNKQMSSGRQFSANDLKKSIPVDNRQKGNVGQLSDMGSRKSQVMFLENDSLKKQKSMGQDGLSDGKNPEESPGSELQISNKQKNSTDDECGNPNTQESSQGDRRRSSNSSDNHHHHSSTNSGHHHHHCHRHSHVRHDCCKSNDVGTSAQDLKACPSRKLPPIDKLCETPPPRPASTDKSIQGSIACPSRKLPPIDELCETPPPRPVSADKSIQGSIACPSRKLPPIDELCQTPPPRPVSADKSIQGSIECPSRKLPPVDKLYAAPPPKPTSVNKSVQKIGGPCYETPSPPSPPSAPLPPPAPPPKKSVYEDKAVEVKTPVAEKSVGAMQMCPSKTSACNSCQPPPVTPYSFPQPALTYSYPQPPPTYSFPQPPPTYSFPQPPKKPMCEDRGVGEPPPPPRVKSSAMMTDKTVGKSTTFPSCFKPKQQSECSQADDSPPPPSPRKPTSCVEKVVEQCPQPPLCCNSSGYSRDVGSHRTLVDKGVGKSSPAIRAFYDEVDDYDDRYPDREELLSLPPPSEYPLDNSTRDVVDIHPNLCPYCGTGVFVKKTSVTGYLAAIFCFPCGLYYCLTKTCCYIVECTYCHATTEKNPSTMNKSNQSPYQGTRESLRDIRPVYELELERSNSSDDEKRNKNRRHSYDDRDRNRNHIDHRDRR